MSAFQKSVINKHLKTLDNDQVEKVFVKFKENYSPQKIAEIKELNKQLQEKKNKFLNRIKDNLGIEKISKKLEAFYDFNFKTFISELKKQKVVLSLMQQDEWEEYSMVYKSKINQIQSEIEKTDKGIDQMVYKLYELTDEEIAIIEKSI